jgi:hypothetical protein
LCALLPSRRGVEHGPTWWWCGMMSQNTRLGQALALTKTRGGTTIGKASLT